MSDTYTVVSAAVAHEIRIKGSRFLAEAIPAAHEEIAQQAIAAIRRREYAATHHCTAYRVEPEGTVTRFNDDGEPSGTAGLPILRQIESRGLTNTLVVVTRYFGGVKLGTGGLIRAYGEAASEVLDRAPTAVHVLRTPIALRFAYPDTSPALHTLGRFDGVVVTTEYADDTRLTVAIRRSQVEAFLEAFVEALGGRGEARVEGPSAG